jgi:hypothetical protein
MPTFFNLVASQSRSLNAIHNSIIGTAMSSAMRKPTRDQGSRPTAEAAAAAAARVGASTGACAVTAEGVAPEGRGRCPGLGRAGAAGEARVTGRLWQGGDAAAANASRRPRGRCAG